MPASATHLGLDREAEYVGGSSLGVQTSGNGHVYAPVWDRGVGHLADIYTTFAPGVRPAGGFTSAELDVTVTADGSPDGYFAANFSFFQSRTSQFANTSNGMYCGLQTEGNPISGKVAIFSGFGAVSATGTGSVTQFTNEGTGWKTMLAYPWVVGRVYHVRHYLSDPTTNTWTGTITDTTTNVTTTVGTVSYQGVATGGLDYSAGFVERYFGPNDPITYGAAKLDNPAMNQGAVLPASMFVSTDPKVGVLYTTVPISALGYEVRVGRTVGQGSYRLTPGTMVHLNAVSDGDPFVGWSGACGGTTTPCALTVNTNEAVLAMFGSTVTGFSSSTFGADTFGTGNFGP